MVNGKQSATQMGTLLDLGSGGATKAGRRSGGDGGFDRTLEGQMQRSEGEKRSEQPRSADRSEATRDPGPSARSGGETTEQGAQREDLQESTPRKRGERAAGQHTEAGAGTAPSMEGEEAAEITEALQLEALEFPLFTLPTAETLNPAAEAEPLAGTIAAAWFGGGNGLPPEAAMAARQNGSATAGDGGGRQLPLPGQTGLPISGLQAGDMLDPESLPVDTNRQKDLLEGFQRLLQQPLSTAPAPKEGGGAAAPTLQGAAAPILSTAPAAAPAQSLNLPTPMQQPGWDQAVGERVVWMARQGVQEARIQLNPREMGPVDARVSISQDQQASVTFVANNAATREALEAAMPRLREMLQESGLTLAQSEVSQQDRERSAPGGDGSAGGGGDGYAEGDGHTEEGERGQRVTGLPGPAGVDFYA